jgi:hypothetical protein
VPAVLSLPPHPAEEHTKGNPFQKPNENSLKSAGENMPPVQNSKSEGNAKSD